MVLRSLAVSGRMAGAGVHQVFSCQLLLRLGRNTFGVGFKIRRPRVQQQGPGSQRQPRPSLAYGDQRARGEKGKPCFAEQRLIGAVVCFPSRVHLSRMKISELHFEPWVKWGLGDELPSSLRGFAGASVQKAFSCQHLFLHEGEHGWSGMKAQETTSKAAGPREPQAAQTLFGLWRPGGRGRKRLAFLRSAKAHWGYGLFPEESLPSQNAALRSSFGAVGEMGPRF